MTGLSQHFCIKEQGHPAGLSIEGFKNLVVVLKQMRKSTSKGNPTKALGKLEGPDGDCSGFSWESKLKSGHCKGDNMWPRGRKGTRDLLVHPSLP